MLGLSFAKRPDNYKKIDELISRSAQLKKKNINWLKKQGVTDVINFRVRDDIEDKFLESELLEKVGIQYHHIPTDAKHPKEEQVGEFLNIIEGIEENGGKIHIHCTAGADRTGMYSWIYKQFHGLGTMEENEKEMRDMGHDYLYYPALINWVKNFINENWWK